MMHGQKNIKSCQLFVGLKPAISRFGQGGDKNCARCLAMLEIPF